MATALWRIVRIAGGYLLAVTAALAVLPILFALLSSVVANPGVWIIGALSPVFFVSLPFIFPFAFLLAIVMTFLPALIGVAISEFMSLRASYWSCLLGAIASAGAYWQLSPRMLFGLTPTAAMELAVFALAGAFGELVYWSMAGRTAGSWH